MGLMVDTNVFIRFEKSGQAIDLSTWEQSERVFISAITVSELLIGVHRANTDDRRRRRSAFVEAVISTFDAIEFNLSAARVHAAIYADLAAKGQMIGAHDLIIAATALDRNLSLLTENFEEFSRVSGLHTLPFGA
jgi:tRNA(fMet)-specific endonuclease VapC